MLLSANEEGKNTQVYGGTGVVIKDMGVTTVVKSVI